MLLKGFFVTGEEMVTVDEAIIARYEKDGKHYEILVDPELAYSLKEGKSISLQKMLAVNALFTDSKKGMKASPSDVTKSFGNIDMEKIAEIIVKKGDIQLPTDIKRKKTEEKRKQVAAMISRNAHNPQTGIPHPQERIMNAMSQVHINIDPFKPAEQQIDDVIKAIKEILPISMEEITLNIMASAQHAGRVYGILKEYGTIKNDKWLSDGSLSATIIIAAGAKDKLYSSLNSITAGNIKIEEVKKS